MSHGAKFFNNNLQLLMKKKTKYVSDVKNNILFMFPKRMPKEISVKHPTRNITTNAHSLEFKHLYLRTYINLKKKKK